VNKQKQRVPFLLLHHRRRAMKGRVIITAFLWIVDAIAHEFSWKTQIFFVQLEVALAALESAY
jgi:hypothetical protein